MDGITQFRHPERERSEQSKDARCRAHLFSPVFDGN
jgi:hypothetical protein